MESAAPPQVAPRSAPPIATVPQTFFRQAPTVAAKPRASHRLFRLVVGFIWLVFLLGLLAWHATMTLELFGPGDAWARMTNDQPIISGRHPLHLYHGYLGAHSFHGTHTLSCYDPAYQNGYPKTPVFDSGSRPGELFLLCGDGRYDPSAYKIGVALCCLLIPILVIVACWGAGLSLAATALATGASLLVWWSTPGRRGLEVGDLDLLLASLAILAHVGLLIRFDRCPGLVTWQGMLLTACLGWFANPMLFLLLLPLMLVYYVSIGPRHALSTWHLCLALSELGALAINSFWLTDWVRYWWLRSPLVSGDGMLSHRTFASIWLSPEWGDHADRIMAAILLVSALIGVALLNQAHRRVCARLLGMGTGGLWLLAILGISWEPLGQIGTSELLVPALWFAALPAAYAWTKLFRLLAYVMGSPMRAVTVTCGLLGGLAFAGRDLVADWSARCTQAPHLAIGLGTQRENLVQALKQATTSEARILWEDLRGHKETSRWTALLHVLTSRHFIGGLDPAESIEHSKIGLIDHVLSEKPLSLWNDAELERYCTRYNIGWIVCRSPESTARFRAWKSARETPIFGEESDAVFFAVSRSKYSFALEGQATVLHMDSHHITLADVVPNEKGEVVLSLHYQTGLRATPGRIVIDDLDAGGLLPFVRLKLDQRAERVTITWQGK